MFSYKFCETFKNSLFKRAPPVAAYERCQYSEYFLSYIHQFSELLPAPEQTTMPIWREEKSEEVVRRCPVKKVFLKIFQNSQEKHMG